jgi:hypothetical protein
MAADHDRGVMKAWWAYWLSLAVAIVLWFGGIVVLGRDGFRSALGEAPFAFILAAPILVAGLDLVAFSRTHEQVCRLEAERHAWLRALVGRGYSARTFLLNGVALIAIGGLLVLGAILG